MFQPEKSDENKEERYKARHVAGGHLDIMKDYLVHGEQTNKCISVHIIPVVPKIKGFCIWVVDVKLAYIQHDTPIIRKIFITNPASEFQLSPEECKEVLKNLYALADSLDE